MTIVLCLGFVNQVVHQQSLQLPIENIFHLVLVINMAFENFIDIQMKGNGLVEEVLIREKENVIEKEKESVNVIERDETEIERIGLIIFHILNEIVNTIPMIIVIEIITERDIQGIGIIVELVYQLDLAIEMIRMIQGMKHLSQEENRENLIEMVDISWLLDIIIGDNEIEGHHHHLQDL